MVQVVATIDKAQVQSARRMLKGIRNGYPRAMRDATKRTTTTVRTRIVRAVARDVNVAQNKLYQRGNKRRPIQQSVSTANGGAATGHVSVSKGRIPLGRFASRQHWKAGKTQGRVRTRVSYRIDKGGRRATIKDAFQIEFSSGFVGVFAGWKSRGKRRRIKAIDQKFGPSVPGVAEGLPAVQGLIRNGAGELLSITLSKRVRALHARQAARS